MYDSKETKSSRHSRVDAGMNTQRPRQHTQVLYRFKSDKIPVLRRGSGQNVPPLTMKLVIIDACWEKNFFLLWSLTELIKHTQGSAHVQDLSADTNHTPCFWGAFLLFFVFLSFCLFVLSFAFHCMLSFEREVGWKLGG